MGADPVPVPWCTISTSGLQLGPAHGSQPEVSADAAADSGAYNTVSLAINLLSTSSVAPDLYSSSSSYHSIPSATSVSLLCLSPQSAPATKATAAAATPTLDWRPQHDSTQTVGSSGLSWLCYTQRAPTEGPASSFTLPAAPAAPAAGLVRRSLGTSTATSLQPAAAAVREGCSTPPPTRHKSLGCPHAPKRPPPPVLLVPLSELGMYVNRV